MPLKYTFNTTDGPWSDVIKTNEEDETSIGGRYEGTSVPSIECTPGTLATFARSDNCYT